MTVARVLPFPRRLARPFGTPALPDPFLPHGQGLVDPKRRDAMVAEAAYFLAERRGFKPGHELDDWLVACRQIDAVLTIAYRHATCGK